MAFHLGKPILVMICCGIAAGVASRVTMRPDARADFEVWCFSDQNYKAANGIGRPAGSESLRLAAERELKATVSVKLIQFRAMSTRLGSLFMSNTRGPDVPDLVDIEVGGVARFFRPPVDEVGLLPLNDLLKARGWEGKILESRLATWSKNGVIYGVPLDVHPSMIAYDEPAFREAGVDLASSETWDQFIENGLKFQAYWNAPGRLKPGQREHHTFEMGDANASTLVTMLLQRGINVVDQNGVIHLTDEKTLDTLVRYIRMLVGPRAIGGVTGLGNDAFAQDLRVGYVSAFFCPDWRVKYLKDNCPGEFAGRMRLMKLPAWHDSPYRTSTSGGSAVSIPRNAKDPVASFRLLELLYLTPEATSARKGSNYILPAVKAAWNTAEMDAPDPYFGGQHVRRLIADLAPGVPPRYVSPTSLAAEVELSQVVIASLSFARSEPAPDDDALRARCKTLLAESDARVRRQVAHGRMAE